MSASARGVWSGRILLRARVLTAAREESGVSYGLLVAGGEEGLRRKRRQKQKAKQSLWVATLEGAQIFSSRDQHFLGRDEKMHVSSRIFPLAWVRAHAPEGSCTARVGVFAGGWASQSDTRAYNLPPTHSYLQTLDAKSHVVYIHQLLHELTDWRVRSRLVEKLVVFRLLRDAERGERGREMETERGRGRVSDSDVECVKDPRTAGNHKGGRSPFVFDDASVREKSGWSKGSCRIIILFFFVGEQGRKRGRGMGAHPLAVDEDHSC